MGQAGGIFTDQVAGAASSPAQDAWSQKSSYEVNLRGSLIIQRFSAW
jgi:hypothetical protein